MENNKDWKTQIHRAIQYLAGVCDGARTQDNHGYNSFDTMQGKLWAAASLTGELRKEDYPRALTMVKKYHRQLESAGLELPEVIPDDYNRPEFKTDKGKVLVFFGGRPSKENLEKVKAFPGRRWRPDLQGNPWEIVVTDETLVELEKNWKLEESEKAQIEVEVKKLSALPIAERPTAEKLTAFTVKLVPANGYIAVLISGGTKDEFWGAVNKCKALPERKYNPVEKRWEVPKRLLPELVTIFPDALLDQSLASEVEKMRTLASMSNNATSDFDVKGLKGTLMPFQRAGVEFIEKAQGRAIVADQMGLGKTIQALAYLQLHPELRLAVIVCPASLKLNWLHEYKAWLTTNDKIQIASGGKPLITPDCTILIINYDILAKWQEAIIAKNPKIVIMDEAHYCKNSKSQRSHAAKLLAKNSKQVLLLTGTPVTNRPLELFPLLNMVSPDGWPNFFRYAQQYCGAHKNDFGWEFSGATNLQDLHKAIKPYVVRRTKDQVLKELPPKVHSVIPFETDKREYERQLAEIRERLGHESRSNQLAMIERLKQATAAGKLPQAIDWIKNFLEGGDKLVVFATHKFIIDKIMSEFAGCAVRLTGETSLKDRDAAVTSFQNDPRITLFVGNIQAAGVGITLTEASDVLFVEFPWTPGELSQASDRCHRIGQKDSVTIWAAVSVETIDEDIWQLLVSKSNIVDAITDGKEVGELSIFASLIAKLTGKEEREEIGPDQAFSDVTGDARWEDFVDYTSPIN